LKMKYDYKKYEFGELLKAIKNKDVDVGMAAITKSKKREVEFDFSHDTLESSLSILVSKKRISLLKTFKDFFITNYKKILLGIFLLMVFTLALTYILWLAEKQNTTLEHKKAFFEALFTIVSTMTNSGISSELILTTNFGKSVILFGMIFGLFLFGLFAASLASVFTTAKIKYAINSPADLLHKKVATKKHTISLEALEKINTDITTVDEIDQAYDLLKNNNVDAVVFDTPTIINYLKTTKNNNFVIASNFFPQVYGLGMPTASELREYIDREILGLYDSGEFNALVKKYFD